MSSKKIYIVPIWPVRREHAEFGKKVISEIFGLDAVMEYRNLHAREAYDSFRDQYLASGLLIKLNSTPPAPDAIKVIGITDVDLFEPVFEYLFGEAQLDGLCAVVSTFRLDNRLYGLPEDKELFFDRLYKEIVHELGHTFGLIHCFTPMCVMNPSTYVEQIDLKSRDFCESCRAELEEVLKRYKDED